MYGGRVQIKIEGQLYPNSPTGLRISVGVQDMYDGTMYGSVAGEFNAINCAAVMYAVKTALERMAREAMPEPTFRVGDPSYRQPPSQTTVRDVRQESPQRALEGAYRILTEGN